MVWEVTLRREKEPNWSMGFGRGLIEVHWWTQTKTTTDKASCGVLPLVSVKPWLLRLQHRVQVQVRCWRSEEEYQGHNSWRMSKLISLNRASMLAQPSLFSKKGFHFHFPLLLSHFRHSPNLKFQGSACYLSLVVLIVIFFIRRVLWLYQCGNYILVSVSS